MEKINRKMDRDPSGAHPDDRSNLYLAYPKPGISVVSGALCSSVFPLRDLSSTGDCSKFEFIRSAIILNIHRKKIAWAELSGKPYP